MSLGEKLRHAFAVDEPGVAEPTPEQQVPVDWVCRQVVRRHLTTPALFGLPMVQPLNWVGAQAMHGLAPFVWAVATRLNYRHYNHFIAFLERRGSVEYLARRIEHFEHEYEARERAAGGDGPDQHDETGSA